MIPPPPRRKAGRTSPPHSVFPPLPRERGLRNAKGVRSAHCHFLPSLSFPFATFASLRFSLLFFPATATRLHSITPPLAGSRLFKGGAPRSGRGGFVFPRRPAGRRDWPRRKRGWRDKREAPCMFPIVKISGNFV